MHRVLTELRDSLFLPVYVDTTLKLCTLCWAQLLPVPHPGDKGPRHRQHAGPLTRQPLPTPRLQGKKVQIEAQCWFCYAFTKTEWWRVWQWATWLQGGSPVAKGAEETGQQAGQHGVVMRILREAHRPGICWAHHRGKCCVHSYLLVNACKNEDKNERTGKLSSKVIHLSIYLSQGSPGRP